MQMDKLPQIEMVMLVMDMPEIHVGAEDMTMKTSTQWKCVAPVEVAAR